MKVLCRANVLIGEFYAGKMFLLTGEIHVKVECFVLLHKQEEIFDCKNNAPEALVHINTFGDICPRSIERDGKNIIKRVLMQIIGRELASGRKVKF
jgi:hypothetical protein